MKKKQRLIKYWLEGIPRVGKTCILNRIISHSFRAEYIKTKSVYYHTVFASSNGLNIMSQIWDSAKDAYSNNIAGWVRNFSRFIFVFDLTDSESLRSLSKIIDKIEYSLNEKGLFILVGNKSDLASERQVSFDEAKNLADRYEMSYIEASALTGHNVQKLFRIIISESVSKLITGNYHMRIELW